MLARPWCAAQKAADCTVSQAPLLVHAKIKNQGHQYFHTKIKYVTIKQEKIELTYFNI